MSASGEQVRTFLAGLAVGVAVGFVAMFSLLASVVIDAPFCARLIERARVEAVEAVAEAQRRAAALDAMGVGR